MLTLALDTTTRGGSVAVARGATILAVVEGDATRTHGERLPGELDAALAAAGVTPRELELLAVASGPGAFTGLRIGLAAIQGLAMVLDIPVIAVSALDALALAAGGTVPQAGDRPSPQGSVPQTGDSPSPPGSVPEPGDSPRVRGLSPGGGVATWMDAARGEVFAAHYPVVDAVPVAAAVPIVGTPDVVLGRLPKHVTLTFIGDGAARFRTQILDHGGNPRILDAPAALAPLIAQLGQRLAARGDAGPPHAVQPLYVRRPDAELERLRKASS